MLSSSTCRYPIPFVIPSEVAAATESRDLLFCRPYGTQVPSPAYPALKRWAKLFRPASGAGIYRVCSPRQTRPLILAISYSRPTLLHPRNRSHCYISHCGTNAKPAPPPRSAPAFGSPDFPLPLQSPMTAARCLAPEKQTARRRSVWCSRKNQPRPRHQE